jgi:DNA-binding FadR family transcriptional regulator
MHAKKQSSRTIARLLKVSRWSVREVLMYAPEQK